MKKGLIAFQRITRPYKCVLFAHEASPDFDALGCPEPGGGGGG
jgi:hypothetical protein